MTTSVLQKFCVCFLKPPPKEAGEEEQRKYVERRRRWRRRQRKLREPQHTNSGDYEGLLQYSDTEAWDSDLDDLDVQFVFRDPKEGRWGYKVVPLKQYEENVRTTARKAAVSSMVTDIFDTVIRNSSDREWFNVYEEDVGEDSTKSCGMYEIIDLDFVDLNSPDLVAELRKGGVAAALAASDEHMAQQMSEGDSAFEPGWHREAQIKESKKTTPLLEIMRSGDFQTEETGSIKGGSPRSDVPSLDPQRFRRLYTFPRDDPAEVSSLSITSTQESSTEVPVNVVQVACVDTKVEEEVELELGEEAVKAQEDDSQADEYASFTQEEAEAKEDTELPKENEILIAKEEDNLQLDLENMEQDEEFVPLSSPLRQENQGGYFRQPASSSGIDTTTSSEGEPSTEKQHHQQWQHLDDDKQGEPSTEKQHQQQQQHLDDDKQEEQSAVTDNDSVLPIAQELPNTAHQSDLQQSVAEDQDTKITLELQETSSSSEEEASIRVSFQL